VGPFSCAFLGRDFPPWLSCRGLFVCPFVSLFLSASFFSPSLGFFVRWKLLFFTIGSGVPFFLSLTAGSPPFQGRFLRILLGCLVIFFLLVALISLPFLFPPETLSPPLLPGQKTEGPVSFSFFSPFGFSGSCLFSLLLWSTAWEKNVLFPPVGLSFPASIFRRRVPSFTGTPLWLPLFSCPSPFLPRFTLFPPPFLVIRGCPPFA